MKNKLIISLTVICSIALTAGIVNAAATHDVTSMFGPAGDIFEIDGAMKMTRGMAEVTVPRQIEAIQERGGPGSEEAVV